MSVRQRGNGWQADVQFRGARAREQFGTKAEAEVWAAQALENLRKGTPVPRPSELRKEAGEGDTMQALLDYVIIKRWKRGKDEQQSQQGNAQRFVNHVGPLLPAREGLSEETIDDFILMLQEKGTADSTVNKYLSAINVLAKQAVKLNRLDDSPELEWTKGTQKRLRYFSHEEAALVEQTLRFWGYSREADFFVFLSYTGVRPWIEARRLRWSDIDIQQRRMTLVGAITKNGKNRTVPLSARALEVVERQSRDGQGPWSDVNKNSFTSLWRRVREHLPQISDTVLYTARHTCASWLVQSGIDLYRVMVWMGHSSIVQTQTYAHLAPTHLMDGAAALDNLHPKLAAAA